MPDQEDSPASLPRQNSQHCIKQACLTSSSEAAPLRQYIEGHVSWNYDRWLSSYSWRTRSIWQPVVSIKLFLSSCISNIFHRSSGLYIWPFQTQTNHHAMAAAFGWHCLAKAGPGAKFSYISAGLQIKAVSRFMWIHCMFQGSLHSWSHGCSLELRCNARQLLYLSGHWAKPWRIKQITSLMHRSSTRMRSMVLTLDTILQAEFCTNPPLRTIFGIMQVCHTGTW